MSNFPAAERGAGYRVSRRFLQSRGRVVAGESQDHVGPDLELQVDLSAEPPVRSSAFGTLVR